jgi:prepilin-type N-terminal cleavage/methylation domain-containing protein
VNNRGISLIELIIALAVLAMLMTAVIMMMSNNTVIYRKTKADINIQTTAQETFNTLQDSIMQAKEIEISGYVVTNPGTASETVSTNEVTYKKPSIAKTDTSAVGFDTLKVTNASNVTTYTYIRPTKLKIKYSVKATDTIDNSNCTVTYYFCRYANPDYDADSVKAADNMPTRCNVYVSRVYDSGSTTMNDIWTAPAADASDEDKWTPASTTEPTAAQRNKYNDYLFTSSLQEITFTVDYESQSIDLNMDFADKSMIYHKSGIVSVRNYNGMKDMRDRKTNDVVVTETTTTGDGSGGTPSGGSGETTGGSGSGGSGTGN